MKKLLSLLTLFVSFNCIGQYSYSNTGTTNRVDSLKKEGFTFSTGYSSKYADTIIYKPLRTYKIDIHNFKVYIDSTYLQRIIEALEEREYTLVKLPKKQ